MRESVTACCLRCGHPVTGTSYEGWSEAVSRLRNNLGNHRRGRKCARLQQWWGHPRAYWGDFHQE